MYSCTLKDTLTVDDDLLGGERVLNGSSHQGPKSSKAIRVGQRLATLRHEWQHDMHVILQASRNAQP